MTMLLDAVHAPRIPLGAAPIRVAAAVSLLVHLVLIWGWLPRLSLPSFELPGLRDTDGRLTVRLAPPPAPPPAPAPAPAPSPALQARPRPAPPVIALERPAPAAQPAPPAIAPVPVRPPANDMLAYVEARRRARIESESAPSPGGAPGAPAVESENARASRLATANLATQRQITFGYDPTRSGGVFQVERLTIDYAEFTFVGWNRDARRHTKQTIEVRKGNNRDIRIAVVRRMIAIIRDYEPVEFLWDSQRLGHSIMLSSRLSDNAGLEDFMLQEFFTVAR